MARTMASGRDEEEEEEEVGVGQPDVDLLRLALLWFWVSFFSFSDQASSRRGDCFVPFLSALSAYCFVYA